MPITRRALVSALAIAGCASVAEEPQPLTFSATDGASVSAYSYGRGDKVLLLVPGGHGQGSTWTGPAVQLSRAGLRVIAMDHRGFAADSENVRLDVLGVVRTLRAQGLGELSVVGASWGGWAAAMAAIAGPAHIDRLVLLAHSPVDQPEKIPGRKLFLVARDDPGPDGKPRLEAIRRQYELALQPKRLVVLEGSAHAQRLFDTAEGARLVSEIRQFVLTP